MAVQRYISTSFWDDEWIQTLGPSEKLLYLYLMTNPLTNIAGVYEITIRRICFDTGFKYDTVSHILRKFEQEGKAYLYKGYMILPSWPEHQKWKLRTKIRDGIISALQEIPADMLQILADVNYRFDISLINNTTISSKQRQSISGSTIKKVYEKYKGKCAECGSKQNLEIHHIIPIKEGGTNSIDNLIVLCHDCHNKKHSPGIISGHEIQSRYLRNYSDTDTDSDSDTDTDTDIKIEAPTASPPAPIRTKAVVAKKNRDEDSELYQYIKVSFEKVHGNFADYAKEGAAIKRIIKLTKGDAEAVRLMLQTFYKLYKSNDKYWSSMPFIPSRLASSGVWEGVKEVAMKAAAADDTSWVEEVIK